jgi:hypothetical protein
MSLQYDPSIAQLYRVKKEPVFFNLQDYNMGSHSNVLSWESAACTLKACGRSQCVTHVSR